MERIMPSLSIKDVPEALLQALRQRAARNHRSLQGELMALLEAAATLEPPHAVQSGIGRGKAADWQSRLAALRAETVHRGHRDADQVIAEMRRSHPEPRKAPSSTEIIRQMRDEHYGEAWVAGGIKDGPWPPTADQSGSEEGK
jgi:plasmid stability protein